MFVISKSDTIKWPVTVSVAQDGGTFKSHTFTAVFKRAKASFLQELPSREGMTDATLAKEIMVGWDDVHDSGEEVDFSPEMLDRMLDENPGVATAIVVAFMDSVNGANRKN